VGGLHETQIQVGWGGGGVEGGGAGELVYAGEGGGLARLNMGGRVGVYECSSGPGCTATWMFPALTLD
jgi:hypothetical protein